MNTIKSNHSKGNVEVEGVMVPEDNNIEALLIKYKDKLGSDTVDSLLYLINGAVKNEVEEVDENKNTSRKTFRK